MKPLTLAISSSIIIGAVVGVVLARHSCAHADSAPPSFHVVEHSDGSYTELRVLHDDKRHVTCWLAEASLGSISMYCMRDIDLQDGLPKE
jgi:hypothetical protein